MRGRRVCAQPDGRVLCEHAHTLHAAQRGHFPKDVLRGVRSVPLGQMLGKLCCARGAGPRLPAGAPRAGRPLGGAARPELPGRRLRLGAGMARGARGARDPEPPVRPARGVVLSVRPRGSAARHHLPGVLQTRRASSGVSDRQFTPAIPGEYQSLGTSW